MTPLKSMTLGSLFDGIGGFPLSAVMCGIEPRWASEIEPFPILVTHKRFPNMKHLGSVTEINGAEVEPVDIITFGSPCQDLSVAGKQAGIHEGARSNLFFEAVRIIKEMRQKDESTGRSDVDARPRYAVWENVPGAFSSNGGKDFQAVLQALAEVADPDVSIPLPDGGKWLKAGCIVGDGYSIAWRVYDAQFWGVPQRRKRIYLIADFGSERAGEILFERESMCRDTAKGREEGQGTAEDAEGSVGRSSENRGVTYGIDCRNAVLDCEKTHTLQAKTGGGFSLNYTTSVLYEPKSALEENWDEATVKNALRANASTSSCAVVCCQNTGQGWWNQGEIAQTLRTPCGGDATKANLVVYDMQRIGQNGESGKASSLKARDYKDATDLVCYDMTHANDVIRECQNVAPTLQHRMGTGGNQVPIKVDIGKPPRKYIVRRLIPLECCRLQGYPDGWTENLAVPDPTIEEVEFFTKVWADWAEINGTKPKSLNQVIKWLADPQSDSAEYKAYGNSLAIPCSYDVLRRIANNGKNDSDRDTGR